MLPAAQIKKEHESLPGPEQVEAKPCAPPPPSTALVSGRAMTPAQLAALLIDKENFDVEKLARLMELQADHEANEARKAYINAMVHFSARMTTILKTRTVEFGTGSGRTYYKFAGLPETFEQVRPLMEECQFTLWFTDMPPVKAGNIRLRGVNSHIDGHAECMELEAAPDQTGNKNAAQAVASIVTYLRRTIAFCLLGLVAKDELDDDGAGGKQSAKPESVNSDADEQAEISEQEARLEFKKICLEKTGAGHLTQQVLYPFLQEVRARVAAEKTADCLPWLQQQRLVWDGTSLGLGEDQEIDPRAFDEPAENAVSKFVCARCRQEFVVAPAGGLCPGDGQKKCLGRVTAIVPGKI